MGSSLSVPLLPLRSPSAHSSAFTSREPGSSRPVPRSDCSALPEYFRHRSPPPTRKRAALPAGGRAPGPRRRRGARDTWAPGRAVAELRRFGFPHAGVGWSLGSLGAFHKL
ncbi:unnamed protein product [Pipistrellus nathusii]|uniref:Uncharacterized protein n=1 Tax=Pipistrellus nathusii TaxID=59473 RepID=A0ABN9ZVX0_PIPNA